jgi:hypothetical protein
METEVRGWVWMYVLSTPALALALRPILAVVERR